MENYLMLDGKRIELSDETVANLKEKFAPKDLWARYQSYLDKYPKIEYETFGNGQSQPQKATVGANLAIKIYLPPGNGDWFFSAVKWAKDFIAHHKTGYPQIKNNEFYIILPERDE